VSATPTVRHFAAGDAFIEGPRLALRAFGGEARLDVHIGGMDEIAKRCGVRLAARVHWHVPHALAVARQQTSGIFEQCAVKEADVDMTLE
jgi:hypothetical protein